MYCVYKITFKRLHSKERINKQKYILALFSIY
uniref:Uncharacterized protein n=1 Tax=Siphoviridae sp. ctXZx16 TaxID=2826371 RepID=A0A8S5MKT7_9CAUD|nr:MAG TPA: hypothetical protein [Siphoviridae sp. ctXZx16]